MLNLKIKLLHDLTIWIQIGTSNKLLVVGCESGLVICAHVARRQEVFCKQLESAVNACVVVDQSIIVGCEDGKVDYEKHFIKVGNYERPFWFTHYPIETMDFS